MEEADWRSEDVPRATVLWEVLRHLYVNVGGRPAQLRGLAASLDNLLSVEELLQSAHPSVVDKSHRDYWEVLFDLLGYRLDFRGSTPVLTPSKAADAEHSRRLFALAGADLDGLVRQVAASEPITLRVSSFEVPLPLGTDFWAHVLHKTLTPRIFIDRALSDRQIAFLYMGMAALDPETLAVFRDTPEIVDAAMDNSAAFAEFARSIRVAGGRVVCPLAPDFDSFWADIVGSDPKKPALFLRDLLRRDHGRAVWFLDTIVHLPKPQQRYALGAWLPTEYRRREFALVYNWFRDFGDPSFLSIPFRRSSFDPAALLPEIAVREDGSPLEPTSALFVRRAMESVDIQKDVKVSWQSKGPDDRLTAATLLEIIFARPERNAQRRAEAFSYAQRMLGVSPPDSPADLARAIRGRELFPALLVTLERMPVRRSSVVTLAIRRAEFFRQSRAPAIAAGILQFQACLALIRGLVEGGAITSADAETFVEDLSAIQPAGDDMYHGQVIDWFFRRVLSPLRPGTDQASGADDILQLALSGRARNVQHVVKITYAGFDYLYDPVTPAWNRLTAIRGEQRGPGLDASLAFADLSRRLSDAGSDADLHSIVDELGRRAEELAKAVPTEAGDAWIVADRIRADAVKELGSLRANEHASIRDDRKDLDAFADWTTAYVLLSWAYAASLGDSSQLLLAGDNVARRHDLGAERHSQAERAQVPWRLPVVLNAMALDYDCGYPREWTACASLPRTDMTAKWHLAGAVCGLDLALGAPFTVKDTYGSGKNPAPDVLGETDRAALLATTRLEADLAGAHAPADVAAALAAGRRRLAQDPSVFEALPERRAAAFAWARTHEPEATTELVTLLDLLRLGAGSNAHAEGFNFWGGNLQALGAGPRLRIADDVDFELYASYYQGGYLGAMGSELRLRLAELMAHESVPMELTPVLYAAAVDRLLNYGLRMADWADWSSLGAAARALSVEEIQNILGELTKRDYLRLDTP